MIQRNITSFFTKSNTKNVTSETSGESIKSENGDQSTSAMKKRKREESPNELGRTRSNISQNVVNTTKNTEEKTKSPNLVQHKKKNKKSLNNATKDVEREQDLSLCAIPSKNEANNTLKNKSNFDVELESTSNDSMEESNNSKVKKSIQIKEKRKVTQLKYSSEEEKEEEEEEEKVYKLERAESNEKENISNDKEKQSENNLESEKKEQNLNEIKNTEKDKNKILRFFAPKQTAHNTQDEKKVICSYNPNASNYDPIADACWKEGEMVPYIALTRTLELIEETSARLKIIEILSNYLRSVIVLSPNNLLPSIYLCLNQLAPSYEGIMLGVAETNLLKAIAQCTGRTVAQLKTDIQSVGDIGLVAEGSRCNQRTMFQPPPLTVKHVYASLKEIAQMTGQASLSRKLNKIQTLFVACRSTEARYLIRSLAGKLRIGLAEQSVLQALALACTMTPPEKRQKPILDASKNMSKENFKQKYDENALILKTTYCECPNYDLIISVLLEEGIGTLPEKCKMTPGIPIKPMLAQPTKGVQEVLTRFEGLRFTCEWKYDGERAQIHIKEDGDVRIYSRNQENNTSKYPDIVRRLKNARKESVKNCILDCEAVAWDTEKKQILPFQVLSTRKRKDAIEADIKVQVCVFMFDLLYLNNESLVKLPFIRRRELLKENFIEVTGEWQFATSLDTSKMEEVQDFLEESVKGNCEGLMIKTLEEDATYEIAKRSRNWLKLKKDYLDGVGDTLDAVVIGGYIGKGKRTGTYGGYLLACYDQENEEYQSLCKIGTGFSEDDLQKHAEFLKQHIIPQPKSYYRYDPSHEPDHWFEPVQVWEIKCADLSLSPVHRAAIGIVDPEKGISLRFPRFIRVRDDKNCEDATSAQQIAQMYNSQEQIRNQNTDVKGNEEDFY